MAILRCTEAFATTQNGVPVVCNPGQLVESTDPLVKGHEQWFEPVEVTVARATPPAPVEQATAAPGEKRSTPRAPAKSKG
jgi:hypothetical protein